MSESSDSISDDMPAIQSSILEESQLATKDRMDRHVLQY
jgi:hypothetical protein